MNGKRWTCREREGEGWGKEGKGERERERELERESAIYQKTFLICKT